MRYSKAFIPTLKESPADAESVSHKLMVRAGLIRKLISGVYSYLPLGFKTLKKVEAIIRDEMDKAGALEILMPALHPAELWHETGRYDVLGEELVKFKDRSGREMVIGPTHEEVITDIARNELRSYKDLPKTIYQIQTKLRDEPRPRFGIIRSKEFIMKDAYSFDKDEKGLDQSYKIMFDAYHRIFQRCGLDVISVEADSGFMGGSESAEFMLLSDSGEDLVVICEACEYKSTLAKSSCVAPKIETKPGEVAGVQEIDTPNVKTIDQVSKFLKCKPAQMIKTLIYIANNKPIAVLVRGDHDLNEAKLAASLKLKSLELADEKIIQEVTEGPLGFSGPCGLKGIKIFADQAISTIKDGVTGANKKDKHILHVVPGRDFDIAKTLDLRYVVESDPCPKCNKPIKLKRAIELGHVFKLGTKYSDSMKARFTAEDGKEKPFIMGCYGIGVNRIVAAAVEQSNDKYGIIWPIPIAPYQVIILSLNADDERVVSASENLYQQMQQDGVDALLDDRNISAGIKFKDADLIGIPIQVVVGAKNIVKSVVEVKLRSEQDKKQISLHETAQEIKALLNL
ncbi:proline--tRNA ligase [Candidatus Omnitrophota bacterium]